MQDTNENNKMTGNMDIYYNQAISFLGKLIEYVDDIDAILKDVAAHYDADRAYVFEFSEDRKTIDNTHEWCKDGIVPQIDVLQKLPYESAAAWVEEFERVGAFFISALDKDVEANSLTYEILEPQGIDSLITAPIFKNNEIIGFIGVDNPHENMDDVVILKATASIIYSEISRKIAHKNKMLEEITHAHKKQSEELGDIKDILAAAEVGIWRIELVDNEEPRMFVDETMRQLLGIEDKVETPEEIYRDWFSNITPDAVASVLDSFERMKQGLNDENTYLWQDPIKGIRYVRSGGTSRKIPGGYSLQGYHCDVDEVVRRTQTDQMTGLFNKREYEEKLDEYNDTLEEDNFIYVSIDANGLKQINDTKGHGAGDEMLVGVAQCMQKSFGHHGQLYRIGGDEFIAILFCDDDEIYDVLEDFDKTLDGWSGELVDRLSVSYGWVSRRERPDASVRQLGAIAEARMYEAKSAHYKKQGVDRRGQYDVHKALHALYTKILKINISDDSYQIVSMNNAEQSEEKGFSSRISEWLLAFGKTGQVYQDDLDNYLQMTDLQYMREYFSCNKTPLHIFYRRKYDNGFKPVMMEIIPANDFEINNMRLFLYVKSIE